MVLPDFFVNLFTVLVLLGVGQALFLIILLLSFQQKSFLPAALLSLLLFDFSLGLLGTTLGTSGMYEKWPHLIRVGEPVVFLYGPTLYLYVRALTGQRVSWPELLHFLPFLLVLVAMIPFFQLSGAEKIAYVDQYFKQSGFNTEALAIVTIRQLHLLAYIGLGFGALRRWERRIRQEFSNLEKLSLEWLRRLLLSFALVTGVAWLTYALILQGVLSLLDSNIIASLLVAMVIYSLGYLGFRQARQRLQWQVAQQAQPQKPVPDKPTPASPMDEATAQRLLEKLNALMQEEKLFTQADLSLQSLADQLGIQPYLLSQLLNRHLNRSFFDYINQFRIEEVKARLRAPDSSTYTLLSIAMDAGFNSKSTFNEVFKKYTGQTPSAYRKANLRIS